VTTSATIKTAFDQDTDHAALADEGRATVLGRDARPLARQLLILLVLAVVFIATASVALARLEVIGRREGRINERRR
jgi:hypothetical protein